jgi:AraC-like DNA-binding protein
MEPVETSMPFFSEQVFEARRFAFGRESRSAFAVVSAGAERTGVGYEIDRRSFPYIGLEFVAAGRGTLTLGRREVTLGPGVFFVYDGRTPHRIRADAARPMVKYFVDVSGTRARSLLQRAKLAPGTSGRSASPDRVVAIFEELIRAGLDGGPHALDGCRALIEALAWRLSDRADDRNPGAADSDAFSNYLRCRRELERSASTTRSLDDLAERCGLTAAYVCRLFKRFDSSTPYKRLVRLRIARAAALLREGHGVAEVSRELGFANPYHFSRQFHNEYGVPPSSLRRLA